MITRKVNDQKVLFYVDGGFAGNVGNGPIPGGNQFLFCIRPRVIKKLIAARNIFRALSWVLGISFKESWFKLAERIRFTCHNSAKPQVGICGC